MFAIALKMKKLSSIIAMFMIAFGAITNLYAQHLFSVDYNGLTQADVNQISLQIERSAPSAPFFPLTKNIENKDEYSIPLSSVQNTKIVILNEETGKNVVITPTEEAVAQFKLPPFFIEELRQAVLGDAKRYLVLETSANFSVRNVVPVQGADASLKNGATEGVFLPRYLYGPKENVKEAFPKDRKIIHIFKAKPKYIPADPNDPENLRYLAQREEAESYYVYIYELPDGTLCVYDVHFNSDMENDVDNTGANLRYNASARLQFDLSGNLAGDARTATLYAFDLWSEQLAGTIPVQISIDLIAIDGNTLGRSWTTQSWWDTANETYYASPLASQLLGYKFTPSSRDIRLEMNSALTTGIVIGGNTYTWHFGIGNNPTTLQYDWITVMLHEMAHGLGFFPLCRAGGAYLYDALGVNRPGAYDRQLFQGLAGQNLTAFNQAGRADLITSDNLYAGAPGSKLLEANGGSRVKMFAPATYISGSSVSHWDDSVNYFTTFMRRNTSNGTRVLTFNSRKIGMMLDMGWLQPTSNTLVTAAAIAGIASPVALAVPNPAITATTQYTGTVAWSPADAAFAYSTVYTATITLTAEAGYTFSGGFTDTAG
ncbi:MAG: hypothetical protein LBE75_07835, partial [Burkholderiales bacterium]|nr:hypothetical protein [Burkholderiales bacterium]